MNYSIVMNGDHPTRAGNHISPYAPYILSLDTKTLEASDYHHFEDPISLVVFKAVLVNTLDSFVANYASAVMQIVQASEEVRKRIVPGRAVLDAQTGMSIIARAQARLDHAFTRLAEWDGTAPFQVLLPYAELSYSEDVIIGKPPQVDTNNCKPYVNGILFTALYKE